jgi:ATP-dependent Lon protease
MSFPFSNFKKMNIENLHTPNDIKGFLDGAKSTMDQAIFGHEDAKHKILCHLSKMITNPDSVGNALCICGAKGTGKTQLVEEGISKILGLPFVTIPLAGLQDGSYLTGHHYTYEGSQPGKIVESIKKAGCLNPVIFLDELDKVSTTARGREITNQLIKLIDPSQNTHIQDTYFGNFDIDLSKALWIFSCNDKNNIDPILLDRLTVIQAKKFHVNEKLIIAKEYLIPRILKDIKVQRPIQINDDVILYLINNLTCEGGVRKLKELLYEIVSEFNMKSLVGDVKRSLKKKKTNGSSEKSETVFIITPENMNDFLRKKIPIEQVKIRDNDGIGNINGLYASSDGGGILHIEARWMVSETTLSLNVTGNIGSVMKESTSVAKTVAWERTDIEIQSNLMKSWKDRKMGMHINCCELAIIKDGPSATCAVALCLYSLFNNIPIRRDIGITGEMNLSGDVTKIGGLVDKLFGAKRAGCKLVLYPYSNESDVKLIKEDFPTLIEDNVFEVVAIKTFDDALKYVMNPTNTMIKS